jgi:mannose-6-phosphate isomerase-like protein (cupin superfamily)
MPAGKVHRIENPNDTPLEIVEVRAGDRLER